MVTYPHIYKVAAVGSPSGSVAVTSDLLTPLETTSPPQFDGPEGFWSPETLLCAAVADCFVLTFRGVSRAARFEWTRLSCRVEGTLERHDGVAQFTHLTTTAQLTVPAGVDVGRGRALLERAEHSCLIANSLRAERTLQADIVSE